MLETETPQKMFLAPLPSRYMIALQRAHLNVLSPPSLCLTFPQQLNVCWYGLHSRDTDCALLLFVIDHVENGEYTLIQRELCKLNSKLIIPHVSYQLRRHKTMLSFAS